MLTCAKCGSSVGLPADPRALAADCPKCGSKVDLSAMRTMAEPAAPAPAGGADAIPAGKVVNGYRIERLLGRGGMAVVYQATQLSLSRPVALKTLPRHLAANPAFVARFNREAGALASLSHPNIIGIIDRGSDGDLYYFVMEFVDGTDLQAQIAKARPAPGEAVRIATQVLSALEYAHKRGVIHRDIKPGNIMLTSDGAVKVTDFGIAHLAGGQGTAIGLTMAGAQMGTVNYMAPEQRVDAGKVDARADLYAAGVVLYEMLTGQLPLGAFEPASAVNSAVDPRLDAVILKALKRDPEARWKSASEMAAALAPLAGAAPPPHEPRAAAPAMAACPFCKSENRADAKFCLNCGKTLHETCPKCSKPMRAQSKFCDSCGTNVSEWAAQAKAEAERRFAAAGRLEKEGKLAEALAELAAVLAAEGKELDGLRAKAKEQRDRVQAAKDAQDNAFRGGQTLYDAKDYERAIAAWEKLPAGLPHVKDGIAEARKKIEARDRAVADADAAFAAGRWDDAMAAFERAAALVANPAPLKPKMDAVRAKVGEARYAAAAQKAGQATDPAAAIAAWNEALKWKPGDAAATEGLRRAEGQKRQSDRGAFAAKGDQASGAGRKREAVEAWERALALCGPEDAALRGELEGKLRSAKAALAAERQKLVVIGAIGGGVLLFLALAVAILVAIVGKGCDGSSSGSGGGGGGGGGTAPAPAGPTVYSTPESLFDAFKAAIAAGDFDKAYDMNSRQAKAQVTRAAFEQQVKQTFQPWNPGGLNAGHMRRTNSQTYGDTAEVYWQYPVEGQYFDSPQPSVMIREDGGWKFQ